MKGGPVPRAKVTRWYLPVKKHPRPIKKHPKSGRAYFTPEQEKDKPVNPVSVYVTQNISSGMSRRELVEQFHEYDCDGELVESLGIAACTKCDYWETRRNDDDGEMEGMEEEEGHRA